MERLGETQKYQTNEFKPVLLNYIQVFTTKTMLLLLQHSPRFIIATNWLTTKVTKGQVNIYLNHKYSSTKVLLESWTGVVLISNSLHQCTKVNMRSMPPITQSQDMRLLTTHPVNLTLTSRPVWSLWKTAIASLTFCSQLACSPRARFYSMIPAAG